ncbi:aldehyde dehydrogenase [Parasphingopyxis algicola]|uniref:aldehyde dehydrogenase n=1 Tax=Parasphingopyxis algicola TaxID=2026624 RepID=UPI0015A19E66|nr:aldehyde dehydrogenase [Parasphingopyxis algicola]QLC26384.1 aldehyde dehydrogenase [Parasphingopyxis algicola]
MSGGTPELDTTNIPLDKLYIDGKWVDSHSGRKIDVISPDDESIVAEVTEATEEDVDLAVEAARRAFDKGPWPRLSIGERADWVRKLSNALSERSDDIALCWSRQIGAPYNRSKNAAPFFTKTMDPYIEIAGELDLVEQKETASPGAGLLTYEPVGVVAAIAPWNVPVNTMLNKIGPALIAGCTVIMKPSPETPIEAYIIAQCADEIGLPAGVLNLINAHRDVSDYLVRSTGVDKVSFTGSVVAGQRIASVCGERIARCTLELGGKSAAIVLDDYDLDKAAKTLVDGICALSGQNCAALSRVLVSRNRHDELVEKMKQVAENVKIGHTFDEDTALGPVAMKRQLEKIEEYIAIGEREGATLVTGGKRPAHLDRGYFMEPTIFANVTNDMRIAREEIFGPVICVLPYDDLEQAIEIANDSDFGLSGAVFTEDLEEAYRVARRLRTGTVGQNAPKADFSIGFGGFKKSGLGREGGIQGLKGYLEAKTVLLDAVPETLETA